MFKIIDEQFNFYFEDIATLFTEFEWTLLLTLLYRTIILAGIIYFMYWMIEPRIHEMRQYPADPGDFDPRS